jgi:hypothetical protein
VPVTGAKQEPVTVMAGSEAFSRSSRVSVDNAAGKVAVVQVRDECTEADMTEKISAAKEGVSGAQKDENAPDINNVISAADVGMGWPLNRHDKDTRETLLVFQDKADLLVDAETPLEALIAFYDLFEGKLLALFLCRRSSSKWLPASSTNTARSSIGILARAMYCSEKRIGHL